MVEVSPFTQDAGSTKSPARILLVEDDTELREGLAEYLRLNGMQVAEASCGNAFHKVLLRGRFDVAIVDVNLPDANGFELTSRISRDQKQMGVILLTARTQQSDRIRGYAEGADLYMTKPVVGEELLLAVRNLTRRMRDRAPEDIDRPPLAWQLNVRTRRLTASNGRGVELTGRETLLVEQFVGQDGRPIARQALAEALRYATLSAESRGLDAALRRLRQKFADASIEPPIANIQNIGIRFTDPLTLV